MINISSFKENCNIPNLLSILRIIIIGPFVYYFLQDNYVMATIMIAISGLSDMFDGYVARKLNQITKLGAMLDPVADKITLASVVVCMCIKIPTIMPIIIILLIKEFLMLLAGLVLLKKHKTPPSSQWYGKLATIVFYVSVVIIVFLKAIWGIENIALTITLMCITVLLMVFALVRYFLLFLRMLGSSTDKPTNNIIK